MSRPLRTAVIGAGGFGRHHARIYGELEEAELVCVVDANPEVRARAAEQYQVPVFADASEIPADVEAVSVAVPTALHRAVALPLLERGVSVLVEKPMVRDLAEGRELIAAAERSGAVLQVGHVERFNPAVLALARHEIKPRFIEASRVAPFSFRSADVGVVLDLMIHDIDLVLHLAGTEPLRVEAVGVPVLTGHEDIANARIVFKDGWLYRKGPGLTLEKVQAIAPGAQSLADLQGVVFKDLLTMERLETPAGDPLTEEIRDFLRCVREKGKPHVGGREGLAAVSLALQVLEAIRAGS